MVQAANVFSAVLFGLEKMKAMSLISVAVKVLQTVMLLTFIALEMSFEVVILSHIATSAVFLLFVWRAVYRVARIRLTLRVPMAKELLRESAPVLRNRRARNLYVQLDVVIISLVVSEIVVGWYATADVLFGTLLFVPNVVGAALFPRLARMHVQDPDANVRVMRRSFHLVLLIAVPMGFGVVGISHHVINLLVGSAFAGAGDVFAIFGLVVTLTSLNTLVSHQLFAADRERELTRLMVVAFLVLLPVDVALIWWTQSALGNGAIGAAMAYLVTESVILIGSIRLLPKGRLDSATTSLTVRILAASAIMLAVVWPLRWPAIPIPIGAGIGVYATLAVAFRLVADEDSDLFLRSVRRGAAKDKAGLAK